MVNAKADFEHALASDIVGYEVDRSTNEGIGLIQSVVNTIVNTDESLKAKGKEYKDM